MLDVQFHHSAWEDYQYWQKTDKKVLKRINALIKEMQRTPETGTGEPEKLKHGMAGLWSRRINLEHRLVYTFTDETLFIVACRYHY